MKALKEVATRAAVPLLPRAPVNSGHSELLRIWTWWRTEHWPEDKELTEVLMSHAVGGQNYRFQGNKKLGWVSPQELFSALKLHEARSQRHDKTLEMQET